MFSPSSHRKPGFFEKDRGVLSSKLIVGDPMSGSKYQDRSADSGDSNLGQSDSGSNFNEALDYVPQKPQRSRGSPSSTVKYPTYNFPARKIEQDYERPRKPEAVGRVYAEDTYQRRESRE
jgi:hypothetical protein